MAERPGNDILVSLQRSVFFFAAPQYARNVAWSIMIEEHVVSSAGADNRFDAEGIQQAIREAGFTPRLRNQLYELRPWPLDDTLR